MAGIRRLTRRQSLFFAPRDKKLAGVIKISSPAAFRASIAQIKRNGVTARERAGLILAKNRVAAQLARSNLSSKEQREFRTIQRIPIPKITRRR